MLKELVEVLVKGLVDQPDQVAVNAVEGPRTLTLEVRVAEGDMGKVIGRQGRVAKAVRTVVKAAAVKDGRRVMVEFLP
ncbi:MAG: KH domain-containing protein [Mycobacterium leprae]